MNINKTLIQEYKKYLAYYEEEKIEEVVDTFYEIKKIISKDDLPQLITWLNSENEAENGDFAKREMLSELICQVKGLEYLEEVFEALQLNFNEGHDNDSLCHSLWVLAKNSSQEMRPILVKMINENHEHKEHAEWLLESC